MIYKLSPMEWESHFFNYSIAKLELSAEEIPSDSFNFPKSNLPYDLTFVHCTEAQLSKVQQLINASFVEKKITYETKITPEHINNNISLHKVTSFDKLNEVYYLALEAGKYSRFRLDPNMKNFEFEKLYFEWIFKSIPGKFDHDVFLYLNNDLPIGLLTLKAIGSVTQIGLISSKSNYQGKGIGHQMIQFAKHYAAQKKCQYLTVATQESNFVAMRFYEKNGFYIKKTECILHLWNLNQK